MIKYILTTLYLSLIYLSFVFQGSFFQYEQVIFAFGILIIFIVWVINKYKKWNNYTFNIQDGLFLLLIIGYLIGLTNAVDSLGALKEFYLILIYFFVYLLGKDLLFSHKRLFAVFLLILTSTLSMIGLIAYFGYELPFEALYLGKRIGSLLQYPNTLAAINIIGIVVMLGIILFYKSFVIRVVSFLVLIINFLTFILTISRGGFIVFALILVIYLVFLPKEKKIPYILYITFSLGIILFYLQDITSSFDEFRMGMKYLSLSLITAFVVFIILDYIFNKIEFTDRKVYFYGIIALLGSTVLVLFFGYQLLPEQILTRLKDINFSTSSVELRLDFYKTAWEIIKDYPLGIGGEGWASFYYEYIPDFYIAREVHSHPLQVGVEAGFLGIISFISFGCVAIYRFIKGYLTEKTSTRYYYLIIGLSFMALFFHSMIDFDLSFASVNFIFYALASQIPRSNKHREYFKKYKNIILTLFFILAIYLVYGLGTMLIGSYYKDKGEELLEQKQYEESVEMFEKEIEWMPEDSMGYLYISMFDEEIEPDEKEELLDKAHENNSDNPEITHYYVNELLFNESYEEAYINALPLVKKQPVNENFELFYESSRYCIKNAIKNSDKQLLEEYSQDILDIYILSDEYKYKLREIDALVIGEALFINNEFDKAEEFLIMATDNNFIKAETHMWLVLLYQKIGEYDKVEVLMNKILNRFLPTNDNFLNLKEMFLTD